jgi:hypothetical protein
LPRCLSIENAAAVESWKTLGTAELAVLDATRRRIIKVAWKGVQT